MAEPTARDGEIVNDSRDAISDGLGKLWWAFLLRGICALVLGLVALIWPMQSIGLLIWIAGLFLAIDGAISLLSVLRGADRNISTMTGVISIVVGGILLFLPVGFARFAFVILGVWAILIGASYLLAWRRIPEGDPARDSARNLGILAFLAGVVLVFWPGSGVVALGWAIAFLALITAAIMFWMSAKFKRAHDRVSPKLVNR